MDEVISLYKIKGYENYYITKDGQVFSKSSISFRGLKAYEINGYLAVSLSDGTGKHQKHYVHRLVAETFIPNPEDKPFIDHINTDRSDNRVENLRWTTQKENCNNEISISKYIRSNRIKARKFFRYSADIIPIDVKSMVSPKATILMFEIGGLYSIKHQIAKPHTISRACSYLKKNLGFVYKTLNIEEEGITLVKRLK